MRAEAERERFTPDLFDQLADIIIELGTDDRIASINRAVSRLHGVDPGQVEGRSFLELVASEDREHTVAGFRKDVEAGEERTLRFQAPRRDGLRIPIEAQHRPLAVSGLHTTAIARADGSIHFAIRRSRAERRVGSTACCAG